jgi:hypothetical protein
MVASLGNASLPAGDQYRLAKAVEDQLNGQTGLLDEAFTTGAVAWVVHVAAGCRHSTVGLSDW